MQPNRPTLLFQSLFSIAAFLGLHARAAEPISFERIVLSEQFFSEGADFGDIDQDGHQDVVSGPFWYAGPDFKKRHRYTAGERISIKAYSPHFFSFVHDFNGDKFPDVLVIGMPGQPARWFENPGAGRATNKERWNAHLALKDVGNESPTLTDLTGDGRVELVCVHGGVFGFASPNWTKPMQEWQFTPINETKGFGVFTHGLGVSDVDGDGRLDILETNGWHQQTKDPKAHFTHHPHKFAQAGGSQMFAYDFDGDGDNDVLSVQNAHAYGLTWFERRGKGEDFLWVPHKILTNKPNEVDRLPAISQMHGVALADMDGDGVKDIVTGKRFFAHGGGDPGAFQLPTLYWFRTVRENDRVRFEADLIDNRIGVGTQLSVGDINGDGRNDIVVGNKLGTHVLLSHVGPSVPDGRGIVSNSDLALAKDAPGTDDFARGVRETGPLSPEQEQTTFVLPPGFEIQLVASEPQINKPLNMAFDARGRLWVTNTLEYPYPVEVGTPGRDSVKILEDTDEDGHYEKVTTFADGLNIPMGLYPYKDGVICYSIPYIWHLRDRDGDGKCDQREKLYGPFDHTRDTHGMCNSFVRGYDGWVYACHGFNNQSSVKGKDGNEVVMHSGNTFRFKLDGSRIEHFTHGQVNPFGLAYDARGDLLSADCHTKPVTLLLQGGYYDSFGKPHDGLGYVPDVMDHLHGSTAIGGIAISPPKNFPSAYANNTFGGNVMTSRINRNSLIYEGSSVQAQEEPDLLISGDSWFRPVDLKFGPDGALYVADFYNRIIGHYEVPLEHPGRDRDRGRIWRIVYRGNELVGESSPKSVADMSVAELVRELGSELPTRRILATDRLTDVVCESEEPSAVVEAIEGAFANPRNVHQRVHAMWALHRLVGVKEPQVSIAIADGHPLVRTHAFRVIGETQDTSERTIVRLKDGFSDPSAVVRRAAATAASQCVRAEPVDGLLELARNTPDSDPHLKHVARMALRDQLRDESNFIASTKDVDLRDVSLIAGICLSLQSRAGNAFIGKHIEALANDKQTLGLYIEQAMKGVTAETADSIVTAARSRFADDDLFQFKLLNQINASKAEGEKLPAAVMGWASELAVDLLDVENKTQPISWSFIPHSKTRDATNPWSVSKKRKSSDNTQTTELWSSFPRGEQRTGVYRSGTFALPATFEFFLAGHDGFPQEELQGRNYVCVRDAKSLEELKRWSTPRNDTAQLRRWETDKFAGRRVIVELVDGDVANAFAWLAAGRFSVHGLNPSSIIENRRVACLLVRDFKLQLPLNGVEKLMLDPQTDRQTRVELLKAWGAIHDPFHTVALAEAMDSPAVTKDQQLDLVQAVHEHQVHDELFRPFLKNATAAEQSRIIKPLLSEFNGIDSVLNFAEQGWLNCRVLADPAIREQIAAKSIQQRRRRFQRVLEQLPSEEDSVQQQIEARRTQFLEAPGDALVGKSVFKDKCAVCHQIAGKGKQVGPNLDGIGNRGVDRLCEDVLAPHRNVDISFRASTVVLDDGRSFMGLIKAEDEKQITLIDNEGKSTSLKKDQIELRKESTASAMPGNLGDQLSKQQFCDLMSYLMDLTR